MAVVHLRVLENEATPGDMEELESSRPKTRVDCIGERDARIGGKACCPYVSCKFNTYLRVNKDGTVVTPDVDVTDMRVSTCVLDYEEGADLKDIAKAFNCSVQAVQSYLERIFAKIQARGSKFSDFEIPERKAGNLASAEDHAMSYVSWAAEGKKSK
jgi:hypothetical protein